LILDGGKLASNGGGGVCAKIGPACRADLGRHRSFETAPTLYGGGDCKGGFELPSAGHRVPPGGQFYC
jgi:hypothetical protein